MPLNTNSQKGKQKLKNRLRSAMNARLFIYATMVMAQVLSTLFGFGSVSVNELFSINAAQAAEGISHTINYQGKLMDSSGNLVADGNYDMQFVIYDAATSGNQLWTATSTNQLVTGTPTTTSVAVQSGLFSILLGDTSNNQLAFPDSLFDNDTLYLGVTIGTDTEMTPRKRLSAVPYAYNSEMLQGQYASSSSLGSDANLFALNQASSSSAYATRTALYVETQGGDNQKDFLVRGNDGTNDVFSISRQGNVTTTGNLQVDGISIIGSATDTQAIFNSYIQSDFNPYTDNTYSLGSALFRWKNIYASNVSSTNIDASGYVSTTNLYVNGTQITGGSGSTPSWADVTLVGATSSEWISFYGATSTGDLRPSSTLMYDLGTSNYRWKDIWASSTLSGNVGINTDSPSGLLDIVSDTTVLSGYSNDITGSGIASSDSTFSSYTASKAFDNNLGSANSWLSGITAPPHWLKYDLGAGNEAAVVRYRLMYYLLWENIYEPRTWTFEGSNNDVDWDVLDTQTSIDFTNSVFQTFDFSNTTAYRYYRFNISATAANSGSGINEVELITLAETANSVLVDYDGNLTANASTTLNHLTMTGRVDSNLLPYITDTYYLGNSSYRWKGLTVGNVSSTNIDALGYVSTTDLYVNGALFTGDAPSWAEVTLVGATSSEWISFYGATSTGSIIAGVSDSYDLGSEDSTWRSLYSNNVSIMPTTSTILYSLNHSSGDGINSVEIIGDYMYMGVDDAAGALGIAGQDFQIIDVSDPENPEYIGGLQLGAGSKIDNIQVIGDHAYLSGYNMLVNYDIAIIDISDPYNPTIVSGVNLNTTRDVYGMYIAENYVYITNRDAVSGYEVLVYDITNPEEFDFVSGINLGLSDWAYDLKPLDDSHLVVTIDDADAYSSEDVIILDISDPTNLTYVDGLDIGSNPVESLAVKGNNIYVGTYSASLNSSHEFIIIDASSSTNLTVSGSIDLGSSSISVKDIELANNYAYILQDDGYNGNEISVIDISDTTNPTYKTGYNFGAVGGAWDLDISGTLMAVALANIGGTGNDLVLMDIGGLDTFAASIGNASIGELNVADDGIFGNDLFVKNDIYASLVSSHNIFGYDIYGVNVTAQKFAIDPQALDYVGGWNGNFTYAIAISDNLAYVGGANSSEFRIFDIFDKTNPVELGSLDIGGNNIIYDVEIAGSYAYVAAVHTSVGSYEMAIIDVSNPSAPVVVGGSGIPAEDTHCNDLVVSGNIVYTACYDNTASISDVYIFDVSDPENVSTISSFDLGVTEARSVQLYGKYLLVGTDDAVNYSAGADLLAFDISDLTNPTYVGALDVGSSAVETIEVNGVYAYIGTSNSTFGGNEDFLVVDIADVTNMSILGGLDFYTNNFTESIVLADKYAYVLHSNGIGGEPDLYLLDISSSTNPTIVSSKDIGTNVVHDLAISGQNLYAGVRDANGSGFSGEDFLIFSVSGISTPSLNAGALYTNSLKVSNDSIFHGGLTVNRGLTAGPSGIMSQGPLGASATSTFVDVQASKNNSFDLGNWDNAWRNIYSSGTHYGTDLELTSDLTIKEQVGQAYSEIYSTTTPLVVTGLDIQGHFAYVVGSSESYADYLKIFDISDPNNPLDVSTFTFLTAGATPPRPQEIDVQGKYAYIVSDNGDYLVILDISNPNNVTKVTEFAMNDIEGHDVTIDSGYAYVVGQDIFRIYDVHIPSSPELRGSYTSTTLANPDGVFVRDGYAFTVNDDGSDSLTIFDVSNPANPSYIATVASVVNPEDVYVQGKYAYVLGDNFYVIDIGDITSPTIVETATFNGTGNRLDVHGRYAYAAVGGGAGSDSVKVFDITDPTNVSLITEFGITTGSGIKVDGKYLYHIGSIQTTQYFKIYDMQGAEINYLYADNATVSDLNIRKNGLIGGSLDIGRSLFVGDQGIYTTGDVTIGRYINSDLLPAINDKYWIGTSTRMWKGLAATTVSTTQLIINGVPFNGLSVAGTDNHVVRMDGSDQIQDSLIVLDDSGNFYPVNNNTQELGLTTNRWSDVWGATVHVGTSTYDITQLANGSFSVKDGGSSIINVNPGSKIRSVSMGFQALQNTTGADNTAIGHNAMFLNTSGASSTAVGYESLFNNTIGYWNTAVGSQSLRSNTTGGINTAIGALSLYSNVGGSNNIGVGPAALYNNISGDANVGIGFGALYDNLSSDNVGIGKNALEKNTNGQYNVGIGGSAGSNNQTGLYNTAIGHNSLLGSGSNSFGYNTAIGGKSMYSITTGASNTAVGFESLFSNTTGFLNTSVGNEALYNNTIGYSNVALGFSALYSNSSGNGNIGIGFNSLYSNTAGSSNIAIGSSALFDNTATANLAIGGNALEKNTTGIENVGLGSFTLGGNQTGRSNTAVGYSALYGNTGTNSYSYNTALGTNSIYSITTGASNTAVGFESLFSNTTGEQNIGIGANSLRSNTTGRRNAVIGFDAASNLVGSYNSIGGAQSAYYLQTGNYNTSLGYRSLFGTGAGSNTSYNTAIGSYSLSLLTTGASNTAVGYEAGVNVSTGFENTALGLQALKNNTSGYQNTAIGANALDNIATGNNNNSFGSGALGNLTSGNNNTALGSFAGYRLDTGSYNVGIGYRSLSANTIGSTYEFDANTALGSYSLGKLTTGDNNASVGYEALFSVNSGYENVGMGYRAGKSITNGVYNIAIGSGAMENVGVNAQSNIAIGIWAMQNYEGEAASVIALGAGALQYASNTTDGIGIGQYALANASSSNSIAIGSDALRYDRVGNNIALGNFAGSSNLSGLYFTAIGNKAGQDNTTGYWNTFVGNEAGTNNTIGGVNTAIGAQAFYNNVSGGYNTAIGQSASYYNYGGDYNTAVGQQSQFNNYNGSNNTSLGYLSLKGSGSGSGANGDYNTGIGVSALEGNATGSRNVAVGAVSLNDNTYGAWNVAVGVDASQRNTTGDGNVSMGFEAGYYNLTGGYNVGIGYRALKGGSSNSHSNNTAIGAYSLDNITNGTDNTAIGYGSLGALQTSDYNTAIGYNAGNLITAGPNTVIGSNAGYQIGTGNNNVAIGYHAFYGGDINSNSDFNVAIGDYALDALTDAGQNNTAVGYSSLSNLQTGDYNTAVGYTAGNAITSLYGNTFLGYNADATSNFYNSMALGYNASVNASNKVRIGNSSVSVIEGQVDFTFSSDARLKENIVDNNLGLEFLRQLRPRKFELISDSNNIIRDGFIAQEVLEVMDTMGIDFSGVEKTAYEASSGTEMLSMSYSPFDPLIINALTDIDNRLVRLNDGITIDSNFATNTAFVEVDQDGNVAYQGITIKPQGTASSSTQAFDSYTFSFKGSSWNASTSQDITTSFDVFNNTISATSSELKFIFTSSTGFSQDLLTISNSGDVHVSGDLHVGRRLYLGSKATGEGSTSTYIFVDDTMAPTSTYIATNADGWQTETTYDYAERYESTEELVPGDLVTADPSGVNLVKRATSPSEALLGIVSTKPGFVTGHHYDGWHPVALAGRVPTRVSTMNGAIKAGDYIAASDIPGVGIKATGAGNVVGVALESYDSAEEGLISVFVKPSFSMGSIATSGESAGTIINQTNQTSVPDVEIEGLALIQAGATEVHISYGTILHYSMVYATPHASIDGSWWVANRTDTGFDIVLSKPQMHDTEFTWMTKPMKSGTIRFVSDNTYQGVDDLTGQPIGPSIDELMNTTTTDDGASTSTDMGAPTSTDSGTTPPTEPAVSESEPATSSTTMVSSTDTQETDAAASSTWPVTGGDAATSTTQNGV